MKLLFNYLPYPMKDSDPVVRSTKKAGAKATNTTSNGSTANTKITKFFSSFYSSSSNNNTTPTAKANGDGTANKKKVSRSAGQEKEDRNLEKRGGNKKKKKKENPESELDVQKAASDGPTPTNGIKRKRGRPPSRRPSTDSLLITSSPATTSVPNGKSTSLLSTPSRGLLKKKVKKGNSKTSPKLRPRRRASQTYFFKYQLARNPLKAEEEDLKLALLASLQQCDGDTSNPELQEQLKRQQIAYENHIKNHKQPKKAVKGNKQQQQQNQQQAGSKHQKQKHPPPQETVAVAGKHNPQHQPAYDNVYLESKRPDTEDFLSFICFRSYPHQTELPIAPTASGSTSIEQANCKLNPRPLNGFENATTGIHVKISNDEINSNEYHNLRRSTSPCKSSASNHTASNSSPSHLNSPSNRRRPTRHSPRLASSSKKISEFDSLNQHTAYDNQLNYEEDMKKASIALEDMAQEINGGSDDTIIDCIETTATTTTTTTTNNNQRVASKLASVAIAASINNNGTPPPPPQTVPVMNCNSNNNNNNNNNNNHHSTSSGIRSMSPFKNNKHLVKGLMTREFAGAFADEEIIFESIKNHKL